jgi:hypothetical protein
MQQLAAWAETIEVEVAREPTADLVRALNLGQTALIEQLGVDVSSGHVLDAWSNPIWLRPEQAGDANMVFVSFGPNRVDDGGDGDDIVMPSGVRCAEDQTVDADNRGGPRTRPASDG